MCRQAKHRCGNTSLPGRAGQITAEFRLSLSLSPSLTLFSQFSSLLIALSLTPCNNQHLVLAKQNGQPGQAEPRSPLWCTSATLPYWTRTRTRTPPSPPPSPAPRFPPWPERLSACIGRFCSTLPCQSTFNAHAKKKARKGDQARGSTKGTNAVFIKSESC